jgi:hypothetical protein
LEGCGLGTLMDLGCCFRVGREGDTAVFALTGPGRWS